MNTRKILIIVFLMAGSTEFTYAASNTELMNNIAIAGMLAIMILIAIVCFVLLNTVKVISNLILPKEEEVATVIAPNSLDYEYVLEPTKHKLTIWEKLLSLRPLAEEKDLEMDHSYDGIVELDNPPPAWFMWLFYVTIVFGAVYLLNYHVFKLGKLQEEEYVVEMKQAAVQQKIFLAKSANRVDENSVKLTADAGVLSAGSAIFKQHCVACHGEKGQGIVGPNLTDEFWIHGNKISDVFRTIKYGVPDKGMISWEKQLTPKQMADVSNYIKSLKDTHPANPKAPQGNKES